LAALLLALRRLFAEPAFSYLRTQMQLGYIVSFGACNFGR
jgi:secreted Zn-dependent insulinase-like peptidase